MKEPKILILRMRKLTLRDLLRDYCMKCGWGFTDAILDREYVPVDEVVELVEPLIWLLQTEKLVNRQRRRRQNHGVRNSTDRIPEVDVREVL